MAVIVHLLSFRSSYGFWAPLWLCQNSLQEIISKWNKLTKWKKGMLLVYYFNIYLEYTVPVRKKWCCNIYIHIYNIYIYISIHYETFLSIEMMHDSSPCCVCFCSYLLENYFCLYTIIIFFQNLQVYLCHILTTTYTYTIILFILTKNVWQARGSSTMYAWQETQIAKRKVDGSKKKWIVTVAR